MLPTGARPRPDPPATPEPEPKKPKVTKDQKSPAMGRGSEAGAAPPNPLKLLMQMPGMEVHRGRQLYAAREAAIHVPGQPEARGDCLKHGFQVERHEGQYVLCSWLKGYVADESLSHLKAVKIEGDKSPPGARHRPEKSPARQYCRVRLHQLVTRQEAEWLGEIDSKARVFAQLPPEARRSPVVWARALAQDLGAVTHVLVDRQLPPALLPVLEDAAAPDPVRFIRLAPAEVRQAMDLPKVLAPAIAAMPGILRHVDSEMAGYGKFCLDVVEVHRDALGDILYDRLAPEDFAKLRGRVLAWLAEDGSRLQRLKGDLTAEMYEAACGAATHAEEAVVHSRSRVGVAVFRNLFIRACRAGFDAVMDKIFLRCIVLEGKEGWKDLSDLRYLAVEQNPERAKGKLQGWLNEARLRRLSSYGHLFAPGAFDNYLLHAERLLCAPAAAAQAGSATKAGPSG